LPQSCRLDVEFGHAGPLAWNAEKFNAHSVDRDPPLVIFRDKEASPRRFRLSINDSMGGANISSRWPEHGGKIHNETYAFRLLSDGA
jgi:hypothetical protein